MVSNRCCVPNCKSVTWNREAALSFHEFPSDVIRAAKWCQVINASIPGGGTFFPEECSLICSKHFLPSDFKDNSNRRCLQPFSVPSIFCFDKEAVKTTQKPMVVKVVGTKTVTYTSKEKANQQTTPVKNAVSKNVICRSVQTNTEPGDRSTIFKISTKSQIGKSPVVSFSREINLKDTPINTTQQKSTSLNTSTLPVFNQPFTIVSMQPIVLPQSSSSSPVNCLDRSKVLVVPCNLNGGNSGSGNTIKCGKTIAQSVASSPIIIGPEALENLMDATEPEGSSLLQGGPDEPLNTNEMSIVDDTDIQSGDVSTEPMKQKSSGDLIQISPNSFLKINPEVIQVVNKKSPYGNNILQFVVNPNLLRLCNGKSPLETISAASNIDTVDLFQGQGSNDQITVMSTSGHIARTGMSTPGSSMLSFDTSYNVQKEKSRIALRKKTLEASKLRAKVKSLKEQLEDLENKYIVQQRQLSFPIINNLRLIRRKAEEKDPHANFILEQIQGYTKTNAGKRYSDTTMARCVMWCRKAPYAYEYFKKIGLVRLPAVATVRRYMKAHPEVITEIKNGTIAKPKVNSDEESSSDFDYDDYDGREKIKDMDLEEFAEEETSAMLEEVNDENDQLEEDENGAELEGELLSIDAVNYVDEGDNTTMEVQELILVESESNENVQMCINAKDLTEACIQSDVGQLQTENIIHCDNSENIYIIPSADCISQHDDHQYTQGQPITLVVSSDACQDQVIYIS